MKKSFVVIILLGFCLASCAPGLLIPTPHPSPTPCPADDLEARHICMWDHPEVQEGLHDLASVLAFDDGMDRNPDDYYVLIQDLIACWGVDSTGRFAYMTPGEVEVYTAMAIGYIMVLSEYESDTPDSYYQTLESAINLCKQGEFD